MKHNIITALTFKYPGAQWSLIGEDYSGLEWLPVNVIDKPSEKEILQAIDELNVKEPMKLLREERDKRLKETDWVTLRAYRSNQKVPDKWAKYMQELADLPAKSTPKLNDMYELDLSSVNWPKKPE
jgi:hypothetical protein